MVQRQEQQRFKPTDKIYYFGFTVGGGHVELGYIGTHKEWQAHRTLMYPNEKVKLTNKRFLCNGKQYYLQQEKNREVVKRILGTLSNNK